MDEQNSTLNQEKNMSLFSLAMFIIGIMGLVNTLNGNAKELPVIGRFKIIKY